MRSIKRARAVFTRKTAEIILTTVLCLGVTPLIAQSFDELFGNSLRDDNPSPGAVTYPYSQDFSGGLPSEDQGWIFENDQGSGRIEVVEGRLRMEAVTDNVFALNWATLTVDMNGMGEGVMLRFFQAEFDDEATDLPSRFQDRAEGDGVAMSTNGLTWYTVVNATELATGSEGQTFTVDIDAVKTWIRETYSTGFDYAGTLYIRFQQYDNYPYDTDGREWDEIRLIQSDDLLVTADDLPETFLSQGDEGLWPDSFGLRAKEYVLSNVGPNTVSWSVESTVSWLTCDPPAGDIAPGESATVTCALNGQADGLTPGLHEGAIRFRNAFSDVTRVRQVRLTVRHVPGRIEISDSLMPSDDLDMPFGEVTAGLSHTESLRIANGDPERDLEIASIGLLNTFFEDDFSEPAIDTAHWKVTGEYVGVDDDAGNAPSPPYALHFFGPANVESIPLDLSGEKNLSVTYWFKRESFYNLPGLGGSLFIEYWQGERWVELLEHSDEDGATPAFVEMILPLPEEAHHADFRLRLRSLVILDDLFVDNVAVRRDNLDAGPFSWNMASDVDWTRISPDQGTLPPGESITLEVAIDATARELPSGLHEANLTFTNLANGLAQVQRLTLEVRADAKIRLADRQFDVTLPQGATHSEVLTIQNTGEGELKLMATAQAIVEARSPDAAFEEIARRDAERVLAEPAAAANFSIVDDADFAPAHILVRFAPDSLGRWPDLAVKQERMTRLLARSQVEREYRLIPGLALVRLPEDTGVEEAITLLSLEEGILAAQPNYRFYPVSEPLEIPRDPRLADQWGMINIEALQAWSLHNDAGGIVVAVLDSGVNYDHPDLRQNMWINRPEAEGLPNVDDDLNGYVDDVYGYDFYNRDGDPADDYDHGSHCAGIIGAVGDNGEGVAGVCWKVQIMALKWISALGYGDIADGIEALEYSVRMGAHLTSNSWGRSGSNDEEDTLLRQAIANAGSAGQLFVAAAGNPATTRSGNNDSDPHYPSNYSLDNIISVMATDRDDLRSDWGSAASAYGPISVDLGAPGSDILSCASQENPMSYILASGTSMAAPHVAGACALVWSISPGLSASAVKDIILRSVDVVPDLVGLSRSGGRLNLNRAVHMARDAESAAWLEVVPLTDTIPPGGSGQVRLIFHGSRPAGTYQAQLRVAAEGQQGIEQFIPLSLTIEASDDYTEWFDPAQAHVNDLAYHTTTFVPDGSHGFYQACTADATQFPCDPEGGTPLALKDDDYVQVTADPAIEFFGVSYESLFVCSNGNVTFRSGDTERLETLEGHFAWPRISALFDDLDPEAGGTISFKEVEDRICVTYEDVPEYGTAGGNSFQIEVFFNGTVRMTWLQLSATDGLVGLSRGTGLPSYLSDSDISAYRCD